VHVRSAEVGGEENVAIVRPGRSAMRWGAFVTGSLDVQALPTEVIPIDGKDVPKPSDTMRGSTLTEMLPI